MFASKLACLSVLILMITLTHALDCSILLNDTGKDLSQVITTCLIPTIPVVEKKPENITVITNTTNEDDPEEPPAYDTLNFFPNYLPREGPRRGLRVRRENQNKTTTPPAPVNHSSNNNNNSNDNPNDPAKCVVHCIMNTYNMIGSNGFPELSKVAASLIKDIPNREMKDFLQDSADECFQQLSETVELDSCTYSARLATCLADKARFNCSEWPVGELPFPHKF